MENSIKVILPAISRNEALARSIVAFFAVELDPTIDELGDIKTAVSEAVTNCIVHGYPDGRPGDIEIYADIRGDAIHREISDSGLGIADIEAARRPFFTTAQGEERSGMGFTIMETFMDLLAVENREGGGLKVTMEKSLRRKIGVQSADASAG